VSILEVPLSALRRMPRRDPPVRYAVPAYFHPAVDEGGWQGLAALGPALAFAIVNPDSGPADSADPRYQGPIDAVHAAGWRVIGYVDTAYGHRSISDVLRDLTAYQSWYRLRGVFLDQVAVRVERLDHYRHLVAAVRHHGAEYVVLNPGVIPAPGYVDLADVVVTFEGTWTVYRDRRPAERDDGWMRRHPSGRFCHLVHGAPPGTLATVAAAAERRHVGVVYATPLTGVNPWSALAPDLSAHR
jgi:hypothetical protein